MIGRVVEIAGSDRHLAKHRGFLTILAEGNELGRVPLDDVAAVISNGQRVTCSNEAVVALAERRAPMIFCGANYLPKAVLWSVDSHHDQAGRMAEQVAASKPLCKRLWAQIVRAKITGQANTLRAVGAPGQALTLMARRVRSGDPDNREAQAARRYWRLLFGEDFRRRRNETGVNSMLNYTYTVLRSSAARAVMAAGLHPSFGLAHRQRRNSFALADDLMEPFRPLADLLVRDLVASGMTSVDQQTKPELVKVLALDLTTSTETRPLSVWLQREALSLARCFAGNSRSLELPPWTLAAAL